MRSQLTAFIVRQHCIPWKLRLLIRRLLPWRMRRILSHGHVNLNRPEDMDSRYAEQGDDFVSMEGLYSYLLPRIPSEGIGLDAGCGIGVFMRMIRDAKPKVCMCGADFSLMAVQRVRGYGFHAEQATFPTIPWDSESFDFIVCTEVLEHLDDPVLTVREFGRILRPGGLLIVSVPEDMGPDHCSEHVQDFTHESLCECLTRGGIHVQSISLVVREPERCQGRSFVALGVKQA